MNNYWEEQNMSDQLKEFHDKTVQEMGLPHWARITCPFCSKKLSPRSIRSIGLCLNARNIGDIAIEFCCDDCKKMDTMYFRQAANDMSAFVDMINPNCTEATTPSAPPLTEEKMYALQYNNLVERMFLRKEK